MKAVVGDDLLAFQVEGRSIVRRSAQGILPCRLDGDGADKLPSVIVIGSTRDGAHEVSVTAIVYHLDFGLSHII